MVKTVREEKHEYREPGLVISRACRSTCHLVMTRTPKERQRIVVGKCVCLRLPICSVRVKSIQCLETTKIDLFDEKASGLLSDIVIPSILLTIPLLSEMHLAVAVQAQIV